MINQVIKLPVKRERDVPVLAKRIPDKPLPARHISTYARNLGVVFLQPIKKVSE